MLALLCFSIGVEIGQVLFITVLLVSVQAFPALVWRAAPHRFRSAWTPALPSHLIVVTASLWLVERISDFWA